MITLYGPHALLEALTFDLRLTLWALGLRIVSEITAGKGDELVRRLKLERI